jgi:hypothetical protein
VLKHTIIEVNEEDVTSSPEEDIIDDNSTVKLELDILTEDQESSFMPSSSSEDDDADDDKKEPSKDQSNTKKTSTKTFNFEMSDLVAVASYLELWHAELLEMSPRLNSLLKREQDLNMTTAFTNPFESNPDLAGLGGPILIGESGILETPHLQQIFNHLPPKTQSQPWRLAYSTSVNGFSLRNLYRSFSGEDSSSEFLDDSGAGPVLMIIQNTEGKLFGGFLTCTPRISESFVGNGKSWLFAFGGRRGQKLRVFKWSGQNEHFFRGTSDNLIVGANEGRFGILVDGDLHKGRVQDCATFQDWPLPGLEEDFVVGCLEIWSFESQLLPEEQQYKQQQ